MYDYVIVGGGAGCVLANRLSADTNVSVCVIEAGPRDDFEMIHTPGAFDDCLPYFRKAERNVRGADKYHGADGPLAV
jgi:choline dehydrogenase-like flavoprotein